jgi:replicative DNA helicase
MILNERIAHYEIQIKENQLQMNQDAHEIQQVRAELTKLNEEKTFHEEQLNKTIATLKQNLEKLQIESNDRGKLPLFILSFCETSIFSQ